MHPRPTLAVSTPPPAADETPPRVALAPQVKPKIMRRPAQFSSPTSSSTNNITTPDLRLDTAQVAPQALGSPMPRPWQDDPRFAIALLTIVILVNVALSLWLSPATPASSIADTTHTAATKSTLTPDTAALPSPEEALLFHLGEAGATVSEQ